MRQHAEISADPPCRPEQLSQPVLLRAVFRLLTDAMLHVSRLRVGATAPPSPLARLAEELESLASEVRGLATGRA